MKFTKMQGCGNDYIYVNGFEETIQDPSRTAVRVSDRHFGIGSDGLILILPSDKADCRMAIYNADGSQAEMCGNGIRCVAKYVYDHHMVTGRRMTVETLSGIKTLDLYVKDGKADRVRVNMGAPVFDPLRIPLCLSEEEAKRMVSEKMPEERLTRETEGKLPKEKAVVNAPYQAGGQKYRITCVSMGNPHCVVPVTDPDALKLEETGPLFEHSPIFPEGVNTEFIRVLDRKNVQMRVWERGSGETLACGTGSCACAVACALNGWTDDTVTVHLRGGDLLIEWDRKKDTVFLTGPAVTVFEGETDL